MKEYLLILFLVFFLHAVSFLMFWLFIITPLFLTFIPLDSLLLFGPWLLFLIFGEADTSSEELSKQLDRGHKIKCPWRGNSCPESLVQFPPTSPSALIGGFKDRCDGLLQFYSLPIVSSSAVEQMRISHNPQIDRFIAQLQVQTAGELGYKAEMGVTGEQAPYLYSYVRVSQTHCIFLIIYLSVFLSIFFGINIAFHSNLDFSFIILILTLMYPFNRLKSSSVFVDGNHCGILTSLTVKNSRRNLLKMVTALVQPKALHQIQLQAGRSFQLHPGKILGIMMYWVQNLIVNLGPLC